MTTNDLQQKIMSVRGVTEAFQRAMEEEKPISLVCVGDGEMYFIAYKNIPCFNQADEIWAKDRYYQYLMDQAVRNEVLEGVIHSDIIGLHAYWDQSVKFLEYYTSISIERLCDGYIGRGLHFSGLLYEILKNKRVYLVGNQVNLLLPVLEKYQIPFAGSTTVDYFEDIPRVKDCLSNADFDMAILSAGIPALILAPWITGTLNRCALDIGSALGLVRNTLDFIGAKRDDFTIFNPEAKTDFRYIPKEIVKLATH